MSFKIAELSAFSKAKLGTDDDAIANVTGGGRIVQKNTYYGWVGKIFRMTGAKNANNAVRTELLRALGRAFEINEGIGSNSEGKTTFSPRFMDRLSELLGPAFMREDFGIRPDGTVDSGKPLTKRRITAILDRAKLVGQVRPIYTARVERDGDGDITSVKYEPARDINGQPLVREVEPEDLDNIGEAVMATIVDGV
jgi:hypothetical protein